LADDEESRTVLNIVRARFLAPLGMTALSPLAERGAAAGVFFSRGHDRGHAGRLYVGLSADCITVGFSIYDTWRGPKGALQTIFRRRLVQERELFDKLLANSVRGKRYETYWHRQEGREWVQHPGLPRRDADWQSLQAWIVRKVHLPNSRAVAEPAFANHVERVFKDLYPLYVFTSELRAK